MVGSGPYMWNGCEQGKGKLTGIKSIHIPKFYPIRFYHPKNLLYQLYHTILQYSQHPNFYFTIQHIKIIFLHNKIIYPKTQIKTKTQITSATTTTTKNIPKLIFISKTQYPKLKTKVIFTTATPETLAPKPRAMPPPSPRQPPTSLP